MKYGIAVLILVITVLFFLLNSPPAEAQQMQERNDIRKAAKSLRKAIIEALSNGERDDWKETSRTRLRELLLIETLIYSNAGQVHIHIKE